MNNLMGAMGENIQGVIQSNFWIGAWTPTPVLIQNSNGALSLLALDRVTPAQLTVGPNLTINNNGGPGALILNNGSTNRGYLAMPEGAGQYQTHSAAGDIVLRTAGGKILVDTNNGSGTPSVTILGSNSFVGVANFTPVTTLDVGGTVRATGELDAASGSGVEVFFNAGTGQILVYNRSAASFLPFAINGLPLSVNTTSNGAITTGTGLTKLGGKSQTAEGLSTGFASLGGAIFDHFADAGNTTTTETDLYSDSIPASALGTNGDALEAHYAGITVANASAARDVRAYFGGTKILDGTALVTAAAGNWEVRLKVMRDSSTSVRCIATFTLDTSGSVSTVITNYTAVSGLTLTNANILKITGQASGAGAATNDIVAKFGKIEWKSAA